MKPVYFPRQGFGYFSILLFIDVSPLFQKAAGVFQPSFPAGCSVPFRTGFGETAGFRAAQGERGVVLGGAGARACRMRLHPQISLPRCDLLCEGEVDLWCAYCLWVLYSAQGKPRWGGRSLGRGCRDGVK